jgi:hypothetical protein
MNPLACSLAICFLSSTNSFTSILYGLLKIGGVPGNNSITNSMLDLVAYLAILQEIYLGILEPL